MSIFGKAAVVFVLACCLLSTSLVSVSSAPVAERPTPPVIRVTPPAPVFDEKTRHEELARRRARVGQAMGANSVLILFSAEPRVYTNDVDYGYRQENNLYYLTSLKQGRATLVLTPNNDVTPAILFMPRRSPALETWTGHMYSAEEASALSGIKEIWEASEFEPFINALKNRQAYRPRAEKILMSAASSTAGISGFENVFAATNKNEAQLYLLSPNGRETFEYRRERQFAGEWAKAPSGYTVKDAMPIFADLRLRKSAYEIALLQHAIDITIEAHERSWVAAADAKWEYEVDAEVAYTFKLRNADHWGYPSIVGCGPNATTLHYQESQGRVGPNDLMLMDVGAEYDHYSADVTRTFPVNGKFSPAQAEIYQIVFDAQEAAARASIPGNTISDVNRASLEVIKDGLLKLGLITDRDSGQYRVWFMHSTSHWLGMNVHDVGNYGARLEPGMVFTNEPGIYVRPDALENLPKTEENAQFIARVRPAFEKYKGIGVRIEDDMLITPAGVSWMSKDLPRKLSEVEAFIARARREARR